jgi:Ca-activated chloride channel family protein
MVLDVDGKFANDIKLEDLKIYEDGTEQKITYLAKKENALNIGLVMDNTGSMRTQIERIITAGRTFVSNLRLQDEIFLVRFVNSEKIQIAQEWTSNKTLLSNALDNMYIEDGASAIIDGLYLSANKILEREKADNSKRGALILISDGEDRDSYYKKETLFELFKGSDVQIFTIGLVGELESGRPKQAAIKFINQLSLETGGAPFLIENKNKKDFEAAMIAALKGILTELNSQYVIGYSSTNQKRDGLSRKLIVQIADGAKGKKRQAFIRESFVVPEEKNK